MSTEPKKLYRSRTNKVVAGVCGGVAEYLEIDPTLVRILWVLFTIFGGAGIILYIAALIIVPQNPGTTPMESTGDTSDGGQRALQIIGIGMLALGLFFLFVNLDFFSFRQMVRFVWNFAFPALLIGAGILLLLRRKELSAEPPADSTPGEAPASPVTDEQPKTKGRRKKGSAKQNEREATEAPPQQEQEQPRPKRQLLRSIFDRKLFGVCGGLGEYFDVDPTMMRILFVIVTLMSFGFGILLYLILLLVMPEKPRTVTP